MENKKTKWDKTTCEVCGKPSEDKCGFCNKCFTKPEVQRALFRI